jgi:hypothetical protein
MLLLVDFVDLTLGVLVMHAFLFDVRWVAEPTKRLRRQMDAFWARV